MNLATNQLFKRIDSKPKHQPKQATLRQTVFSVLAAFFGVQSNKNRQRDFSEGKFSHFVVIGLITLILFIVSVLTIVNWVLPD